jgi:hypothetical protein
MAFHDTWADQTQWTNWGNIPVATGVGYQPSGYGILDPVDAFQRFYSQQAPTATQAQRQAQLGQFDPLYATYQALGQFTGAESFGDYLTGLSTTATPTLMGGASQAVTGGEVTPYGGPTQQDLILRAQEIAGYSGGAAGAVIPAASQPYYGGTANPQGLANQQRLAQTLALSGMGMSQYNPAVQRAVESSINQMYQGYLGGGGGGAVTSSGPQGFLKYYMQQRYPGSMATAP